VKPNLADVHVSVPLTTASVGWANAQEEFVWPQFFPNVGVDQQAGVYYVWSEEDFLRLEAAQRAPGALAVEGEVDLTTQSYKTTQYALRRKIPKEIQAQSDAAVRPDVNAMLFCTDNVMRRMEKKFMTEIFAASVFTDLVAGTDFTTFDTVGGDPVKDIQMNLLVQSRKIGGRKLNKILIGAEADIWLKNNADIKDRVKHTSSGPITNELLAQLFGVDQYLVSTAVENTAAEGATASYSAIAGKSMLAVFSPASAALDTPAAGYNIVNKSEPGTGANGLRTYDYYVEERHSRFIEVQCDIAFEVVSTVCGVFFPTVIA